MLRARTSYGDATRRDRDRGHDPYGDFGTISPIIISERMLFNKKHSSGQRFVQNKLVFKLIVGEIVVKSP